MSNSTSLLKTYVGNTYYSKVISLCFLNFEIHVQILIKPRNTSRVAA